MKNYTPIYRYPLTESDGWKKLTGTLPVKMTNDYLFRALLQSENDVLKAIIASVLHWNAEEITSAEITNPILLGESIDNKTFILDVSVDMDHAGHVDLEMQVIHEAWWPDRSLSYICRSFDQLNKGMSYEEVKAVRQIALCDFTIFEDSPEFCATYKLLNERNPKVVYSEKLIITNIDLTRPDLADEEDRKNKLDKWAKLFKAKTWEELQMLAEQDEVMRKAVSASWQLTEEEMIQAQCRAREEWIINNNYMNRKLTQQKDEIENLKNENLDLKDENTGLKDENSMLKLLLKEKGIPLPDSVKQQSVDENRNGTKSAQ